MPEIRIRPYRPEDEEHAIALWQRAWEATRFEIDFAARLQWWRERWTRELVPNYTIIVAEQDGRMLGFVAVDPKSGWLDQIVVDPPFWGAGTAARLIDEAKRLSPGTVRLDVNQTNRRAVELYERLGFVRTGEGTNAKSGEPTWFYEWKAQ